MGTPFLAEMRLISFNFAPKGWALCNGQLLPINQNQALFSILGTTYGGNGQTTFALPDCRSRVPIHTGPQFSTLGERGGEEFHTVIQSEMPAHLHFVQASTLAANVASESSAFWSTTTAYAGAPNSTMDPSSITSIGGSQPHENRQPYLVLNIIIALQGVFPSRN
ncbi:MAG TPA: tail fiber protein [Blastocatellia bacterium]|nr:tail fiber protein [Blastocatellia bacterium]